MNEFIHSWLTDWHFTKTCKSLCCCWKQDQLYEAAGNLWPWVLECPSDQICPQRWSRPSGTGAEEPPRYGSVGLISCAVTKKVITTKVSFNVIVFNIFPYFWTVLCHFCIHFYHMHHNLPQQSQVNMLCFMNYYTVKIWYKMLEEVYVFLHALEC